MRRSVFAACALAVISCARDKGATTDSSLARDIALANQSTPDLQPKDTALSPAPPARVTPRARTKTAAAPESRTAPVQAPAVAEPPVSPRVETPTPAAPKFRGIASGTQFSLTTKAGVCTTNLPGDKITATIDKDVIGENGAVIPAGSTVVLEVASVTPGDKPENATIAMRVRAVMVNDQPVTVPSDVTVASELERHTQPRDKGADRKKVIGGVVAGALIGQIMGKSTRSTVTGAVVGGAAGAAAAAATGTKYDACLPAGGSMRATTREAVPLPSNSTQ